MNSQTALYQEQARAAYKRKDYTKALELFNRAIGRSPTAQLHDNRAACHDRLGDLQAALKDSKRTIQLAKEDPTGYVRAGRILVKMERKSVALEIYALGMKNVKHVGQGFEILKKVHLELMTELSPPRSVDPLTVLPRELAEQILGYLNFRQLMKTCLVSKEWAQFIHRTPNLWRHLDLTHARRKVKNAFVSRAINISRSKLKAATLSNLFEFDKALSALARTCPLEELNLRNTGLISSSVVDTLKIVKNLKILRIFKGTTLSKSALAQILSNASPTLEVLVCEDVSAHTPLEFQFPQVEFPNMRTLEMAWSSGSWRGSRSLVQSLPKMPHLQTLKLHQLANRETITHFLIDLTGLTQLSTLDLLIDVEQAKQIKLPPTIKSLAIGTWQRRIGAIFFASLHHDPLQWSLPLLEELKICAGEVPFGDFELALRTTDFSLTQTPAYLHTLSMTESDAAGSLTKETLSHPRLAELRHLSLESCHGVNDSHLSLVATTLPKLQTLNVSGTEVTGAGVKEVVKNGLKKLVASNCRFIGLDAIQWARTQGVHVENRNTDAMAGGRRVRHG